MAIDYRRLLRGLTALSELLAEGSTGLAAIQVLLVAAREATLAGGATFTEFGPEGGRVVLATGSMVWALGQPIGAELRPALPPASPVMLRVDQLPAEISEPLLSRGVASFTGGVAAGTESTGDQSVAAVHLFFGERRVEQWDGVREVVQLLAQAARLALRPAEPRPRSVAAEEEDRALFLAVAGHELRTPVTVVKGYASMLADRWESLAERDRREAARVITLRADELARLVDRLLGASISDGPTGWLVRTVSFDPVEALERAARELPADLRRTLRLELPSSLPPASGDPSILTSIVAELVTNAVRSVPPAPPGYTGPPLEPVVELQAGADAQTIFIRVCDRGRGLDATQAENAFERFWRGRHDGDVRAGVGLGLYLVRRLVERQNGWVSLRPRDGGGTVAEVRLRRADGPRPVPVAGA